MKKLTVTGKINFSSQPATLAGDRQNIHVHFVYYYSPLYQLGIGGRTQKAKVLTQAAIGVQ